MNSGPEKPRKALGKGLSALLPPRVPVPPQTDPTPSSHQASVDIDSIVANPVQPRSVFRTDRLEELAASIRANGILQPLVVRRYGDLFQLVAGERRWRAAKLAGLTQVPVVVQDIADRHMLELALIENIQREDLNPIETAQAYERLARDLSLSHEEIGRRTGKDRTSIVNMIRLLRLPNQVQTLVAEQRLSMGHARAILGLITAEQQVELAEKAAAQGLSVRRVEQLVKDLTAEPTSAPQPPPQDPNVRAAVSSLERILGTRVRIVESGHKRGRIEIEFYSDSDLDRLYNLIVGNQETL